MKSNDISHVFTSTDQEIFIDQSQYISVVFLGTPKRFTFWNTRQTLYTKRSLGKLRI